MDGIANYFPAKDTLVCMILHINLKFFSWGDNSDPRKGRGRPAVLGPRHQFPLGLPASPLFLFYETIAGGMHTGRDPGIFFKGGRVRGSELPSGGAPGTGPSSPRSWSKLLKYCTNFNVNGGKSGTSCISTSHLRRHSRFSDNDSRPFCFPVPTKTLSDDSCVTITIHRYCLDTCGPCNN